MFKQTMLFSALLSALVSSQSHADVTPTEPAASGGAYLGWQFATVDSEVAQSNGIGTDSGVLFFGGEYVTPNSILFGGGIGLISFDDKNSFDVRVEDQFGNESTEVASATGTDFYLESGYRFKSVAPNLDIDLIGGLSFVSGSRTVDNCSDCPEDDLDLEGGSYLKANMLYRMEGDWYMQLGYKSVLNGDLDGGVNFAVGVGM